MPGKATGGGRGGRIEIPDGGGGRCFACLHCYPSLLPCSYPPSSFSAGFWRWGSSPLPSPLPTVERESRQHICNEGAYTPPQPASAIQREMVLSIPPWAKRGAREQGQLRDRQHRMREERRSTQHRKLEGTSSFSTSSSRTNTASNSWRRKWTNCFPSRCTKNRLHLFHKFIPPTLTRATRPARGHNSALHFPPPPL